MHRIFGMMLLTALLTLPMLAATGDGDDDPDASAQQEEAAEAAASGSEAPAPDRGFIPTERLRWDQEVDYPTDI